MDAKTDPINKRDRNGRFGGAGAYAVSVPAKETRFTPLAEAENQLNQALQAADFVLKEAPRDGDGVPTAIVRASPGSGKSTGQRKLMAAWAAAGDPRNVAFHVPTLSLAEEAAAQATEFSLPARAIRGRTAKRPDGQGCMCAKADLVESASRLGIGVRENFCERKDEDGNVMRCPYFDGCAYMAQFEDRVSHRFLATTYFRLPNSDTFEADQRIVDETFWREFYDRLDVEEEYFCTSRTTPISDEPVEHEELLQAAKDVFAALVDGRGPMSLRYSAEEYVAFATLERSARTALPDFAPDQTVRKQNELLDTYGRMHRTATRFAAVWDLLADAKRKNLGRCERLRLYRRYGKHVLRVLTIRDLQHQKPLLVLDADADPDILRALGCDIVFEKELSLRPNAIIEQLHDRRMSISCLLGSHEIRKEWHRIVVREVLRDQFGPNGGVLVGATKKVVQAFFEDAGHSFEGLSSGEVNEFMLETKLHGASWTWFGGRSLGVNRYKDYSSCIIIGREELPIHALEDQGRALFGDTPGDPLQLVPEDAKRGQALPEMEISYEMTDGSAMAVMVPCHPDPRIRRLQLQSREMRTRQLIERLRLARASLPKRVLIGCNTPIPGLPVDALISWQDLCVDRVESAVQIGLLAGKEVQLTNAGLAAAAPAVFTTEEAAKNYVGRNRGKRALLQKIKADLGHGAGKRTLNLQNVRMNGQLEKLKALLSI